MNPIGKSAFLTLLMAFVFLAGCSQLTTGDVQPPASDDPSGEPAAREPKRLEERVTLSMGDLFFSDTSDVHGGTFHVTAGKTVGIHILNDGQIEHEVLFGKDGLVYDDDGLPEGFVTPLFEDVAADVFVYMPEKVEVATERGLGELEMEAGGELWVRANFPATVKGTWEIACFVPGHYEAGMKATLVIE